MDTAIDSGRGGGNAAAGRSSTSGFTLIETLVALLVLLVIMAGVMGNMLQFSRTQSTVWNRSNMHSSVRAATELLQQEVGQAGRVALPGPVQMYTSVSPGLQTVTVSSTAGMFPGERLVVDAGESEETVVVMSVNSANAFTASFLQAHNASVWGPVPVSVRGGFASGIVPTTMTDGSTEWVLKLYGDINDDGNMVYVEYVCDAAGGNLYRNVMAFNASAKTAPTAGQILLSNLLPNPGGAPCFTYEQKVVNGDTYVINVAISLTTQTQQRDIVTRQFDTETKALLNVAPRNVFDAWQLASIGAGNRIQPMPPTVASLLH